MEGDNRTLAEQAAFLAQVPAAASHTLSTAGAGPAAVDSCPSHSRRLACNPELFAAVGCRVRLPQGPRCKPRGLPIVPYAARTGKQIEEASAAAHPAHMSVELTGYQGDKPAVVAVARGAFAPSSTARAWKLAPPHSQALVHAQS